MSEKQTQALAKIRENLTEGQVSELRELVKAALDGGLGPERILNDGMIAAMSALGTQFQKEEIFLPEVLFAARAMLAGMEVLEPLLASAGVQPIARVALGSVKGDIHNIGKNLVGIMLKGAGFEVIDLGVDVPVETFVEAAGKGVGLIGLSALTSGTMMAMRPVIAALEDAGLSAQVKTMVGGAIVTQQFADSIGADGYAVDAVSAVAKAKELLGIQQSNEVTPYSGV